MTIYRLANFIVLVCMSLAPAAMAVEPADEGVKAGFMLTAGEAQLRWSEDTSEDYLAQIQALYQLGDPSLALVRHINNLLEFYAYGDERVIAASRLGAPSRHRIHLSDRGEIITLTTGSQSAGQDRLRVFGVNPYLRYQCMETTASCWVIHPVTAEPWLQIVENPEAGRELTRALAELIKQMQDS